MAEKDVKNVSRRGFLGIAVAAVVAGVVAGVGGYYAGTLSAPTAAPTTITQTSTVTSPPVTSTVTTAGGGGPPVTTTATTTVTSPVTTTATTTVTSPATTTTVTTTPGAVPAPNTIKIGVDFQVTGPLALFYPEFKFLADRWMNHVNSSGGIYVKDYGKKIPVEIITYDDAGDTTKAISNVQRLATVDKVNFFLYIEPGGGTAVEQAAAKLGLFWFGQGGNSLSPEQQDFAATYNYMFGFHFNQPQSALSVLKWAKEDGRPKTILIITEDTDGSYAIFQAPVKYGGMLNYVDQYGLKLLDYEKYTMGAKDYTDVLLKAKAADPDIICSFWSPPDAIACVKQARELGYQPRIWFGQKGNDLYSVTEPVHPYFDGFGIQFANWNEDLPYWGNESQAMKAALGYLPTVVTIQYDECFNYLQQAIEYSGTITDKDKLRAAYLQNDTLFQSKSPRGKTVNGGIANGHVPPIGYWGGKPNETVTIQIQDKKRRTIWPSAVASAKVWYPMPTWDEKFPASGEYKPKPVEYP